MKLTAHSLKIEAEKISAEIEVFIRDKLGGFRRDGIILGLSGGLDSTVMAYLSARSLGPDKVLVLYMPDEDSKPIHRKHAEMIADDLGITLLIEGFSTRAYNLLPIKHLPSRKLRGLALRSGKCLREKIKGEDLVVARLLATKNKFVARGTAYGSIKHRVRAANLYFHAEVNNLLMVGAANKTEYETGEFIQWGCDQCADIMPLRPLYKTQVRQLAEYLGVPQAIIDKPADPDVIPGFDDKEKLFGSYETRDLILYGLEHGLSPEEMYDQFGQKEVDRIIILREYSRHMRESPYTPELELYSQVDI